MCDQQRLRPAYAYAQSDQNLCKSHEYSTSVKLLAEQNFEFLSLRGGCTGSSESTHVKMTHCWKSHVTAQISLIKKSYAQKPPLNAHPDVSSRTRGLNVYLSPCLCPYLVYTSSEGSGESVHMRRLAWAFAARQCDKYEKLMPWLKYSRPPDKSA